eukprot:scaffold125224_cov16-Tisochrysis_lutea.AAC.1
MGAPRGAAVGSRTDSRRAGSAASAPAERAANAAAPKHMPPPAAGHRPLGAGSAQRPPMGAAVAAAAMQRSQAVGATHRPGPAGTTAAAVPAAAAAAARAPQAAYMPAAPHTPHTAANPPQSPTRRSLFSHVAGQGSAAQRLGPQGLKLASVLPSSSGAAAFPQRPGPCMKPRQPAAGVDGTFLVRRPMQPSPQTPQQQHQQQHQQQQQQQQQQQGKRKAVENECANPARGFVLNPRVVPPVVPVTPEAKAARGTPAGLHSPASPPPVAQGAKKLPNPKNKARQLPSWRQPQHLVSCDDLWAPFTVCTSGSMEMNAMVAGPTRSRFLIEPAPMVYGAVVWQLLPGAGAVEWLLLTNAHLHAQSLALLHHQRTPDAASLNSSIPTA